MRAGTRGSAAMAVLSMLVAMAMAAAWTERFQQDAGEAGANSPLKGAAQGGERSPSGPPARPTQDTDRKGRGNEPGPARSPKPVSDELSHASDSGRKAVNITIDDGPHPEFTPRMLDVLKEYGARATFCVVGAQARRHPQLVKRIVAEGNRLCNHGDSHDSTMDRKPAAHQAKEILDSAEAIRDASGGVPAMYYRAPGGAFTAYSRKLAARHGMRPPGWNVDPRDWALPGVDAIVRSVRSQLANGPTVLLHDGGGDRAQSVEALRRLLPWMKKQGYTFGFPVR
ncbi:polysaccharide deacetylase family protein (plasmid) [Streptomyces sp. HUAS 31]|uniref:polysaccharide deacetylase family protein n=1 Tax=Streptomyces sp. HUAS 31 TaxID=3020055 RepID=UPI0023061B75|nr:polysaccharide deacetylase family protein [Streptomyces sp. HUAS 31]WCE02503.1 polysaccharide deacetylase family protein [Streptomyces sp. HUAS 31]